jgi:hypothetical protein
VASASTLHVDMRKSSTSAKGRKSSSGSSGGAPRTALQKARAKKGGSGEWDRKRREKAAQAGASDDPNKESRQCAQKFRLCLRKSCCGRFDKLPLAGAAAELAQHLKFTAKELNAFQLAFDSIDLDETREIDYDEFLMMLEEPRSPYTDALFALVDTGAVCWRRVIAVVVVVVGGCLIFRPLSLSRNISARLCDSRTSSHLDDRCLLAFDLRSEFVPKSRLTVVSHAPSTHRRAQ